MPDASGKRHGAQCSQRRLQVAIHAESPLKQTSVWNVVAKQPEGPSINAKLAGRAPTGGRAGRTRACPSTWPGQRRSVPPGNGGGRQAGEHVEALGRAGDGLRHQLAGEGGRRDAVARVALGEVHIWCKPSKMGQTVHGDGQGAAPGVVDGHRAQLGEDPQHLAADEALEVGREPPGVVLAAAEDQPAVRGQAEVVHDEQGVVDAGRVGDEALACRPSGAVASRKLLIGMIRSAMRGSSDPR